MAWISKKSADKFCKNKCWEYQNEWQYGENIGQSQQFYERSTITLLLIHIVRTKEAVCYFLQFATCVYIVCCKKDPHSDLQWRQRRNFIAVYICLLLISTNLWDLTQSMQPKQQLFYLIITLSPRPMSIWLFFFW